MITNGRLFVEGADDLHVISALLKRHDIPTTFDVYDGKGFENLMKTFPVQVKGSDMAGVGVVVDADEDIGARWQSVRSALLALGYTTCPQQPIANGLVITEEHKPHFGVWIMPDNSLPGMLEDFVAQLVPAQDKLWNTACEAVAGISDDLRLFAARHVCKARIHTWLAWQDNPGTPMGQAITKRYLDGDADKARSFLDWIGRLFVKAET